MSKKKIAIGLFSFGILIVLCTGCANKEGGIATPSGDEAQTGDIPTGGQKIPTEDRQDNPYGSAEEIAVPTGLASELKSIFSEICGGAKLTILNYNFPTEGTDTFVYVWKNKPTEEKLRNAFEKNEYVIEELGNGLLNLKKGNLYLTIDYGTPDREEGQEIVVLAAK